MKRIHPNVSHTAALAAIALTLGGCRNPSGGIANPFVNNERVPPPATRALAPGQAQPYYPGDPLPVMQSRVAPSPSGATIVAAAQAQPMPSADTNLAWNSPGSSAQVPNVPQAAAVATNTQPVPRAIASAEPAVAIPADGDSLRFELPGPAEPQPFTPIAPVPIPAPQQPVQVAATPATTGVVPASYETPIVTVQPAPSPWRSPEFAPANGALTTTAPLSIVQPATQPLPPPPPLFPISPAPGTVPNNMGVQLRAVPSPPTPESLAPGAPRIRLPGALPPPPSVGNNDGFRPRSSMR